MSAATFKIELKQPARKDGTFAVRIRITRFRRHAYWNLGRYIESGNLNKAPKERLKNWVIKHDDAPQINNAIDKALKGLATIADNNPAATAAGIKEMYQRELNPEKEEYQQYRNFFAFAEELAKRKQEQNYRTGVDIAYRIPEFKAIAGEKTPLPELFSPAILHKYIQALKAKGNGPVTIKNKLRDLRTIYNAGVKENAFPDLGKPFADIKIHTPKKKRTRPTAEQFRMLLAYEPKTKLQTLAKTVATLQYLLQGARVGEALMLQWANVHENYVEYLPQKKATKPKFVPRSNMLNKLLAELPRTGRYVLPYLKEDFPTLSAEKQYNRKRNLIRDINFGLEEISKELKLNIVITSHQIRHAFADALIAAGANPHKAAALLGHSNPKTTEIYIKELGMEDVSEMALSIFEKLEDKKGKP